MPNSVSCNGEIRLSLHLWFETAPPRPIHPDCHTGLPLAPAPLDGFHQDYSSCSMALYMSRVYHPRGMVSTGMEKVLRINRPDGRRVRKFDGLSGRGLWWRLTPQILKSTSLSSFLPAHPPFRGVGGEHSESEGGGYMGRSAARVPIVQRLWWRFRPWAYLRCEGSEVSKGSECGGG